MADNEKLDEVLAWVTQEHEKQQRGEPSHWDQGSWFTKFDAGTPESRNYCSTACCIAGYVVERDGGVPRFIMPSYNALQATAARMPDGELVIIEEYAREVLGLTEDQADALFGGGNDYNDIVSVIGQIKDGVEHPRRAWYDDDYYGEED